MRVDIPKQNIDLSMSHRPDERNYYIQNKNMKLPKSPKNDYKDDDVSPSIGTQMINHINQNPLLILGIIGLGSMVPKIFFKKPPPKVVVPKVSPVATMIQELTVPTIGLIVMSGIIAKAFDNTLENKILAQKIRVKESALLSKI